MNKLFRYPLPPFIVLISFALILISGESVGGFYIFYIALGLWGGALHAYFAIAGIILHCIKGIWRIMGLQSMLIALLLFFGLDKENYNSDTFHQPMPLVMLGLFAIIWLWSLFSLLRDYRRNSNVNGEL